MANSAGIEPGEPEQGQSLSLRRDRNFIIIYLALLISGIGSGISKVALLWLSYDLTGSAASVGIVLTCLTLPGIFSGLISGSLADRFSRLKIVIGGQVVLGIVAAAFVWAYLEQSILLVYGLAFLMGTFFSFSEGPFRAYLPEIFPGDKLARVNAAVSSVESLSMLIGPVLGGLILKLGHVSTAFVIDAATYVAAALMMGFLPSLLPKMLEGAVDVRAIFRDIKLGVGYLFRFPVHRFLTIFFVSLFGIYCFAGGLITPLCENVLSRVNDIKGSTALSSVEAAFGLGGLIGSFFIPIIMRRFGYLRTFVFGALLCTLELLALGFISNIFVIAAIVSFTGASDTVLLVPLFTFMQEKTHPRFLGRAMGALDTLILAAMSLAFAVGGKLGDMFGIVEVFVITGFMTAIFILILPLLPAYRRVRSLFI